MLGAAAKVGALLLVLGASEAFRAPVWQPLSRPASISRMVTSKSFRPSAGGVLQLKAYVPGQFEPQAPDLGPTLAVFLSTFGVAAYWWLVLVPSERRDLAKNKNKGGLNEYLDELYYSDDGERNLEKWFYTEWLERRARVRKLTKKAKEDQEAGAVATLTKQEQEESDRAIEREIENAAPTPNFFSFDNPIVVAMSLALLGIAFFGGR